MKTTKELTTAVLLFGAVGTGRELYIIDNITNTDKPRSSVRSWSDTGTGCELFN